MPESYCKKSVDKYFHIKQYKCSYQNMNIQYTYSAIKYNQFEFKDVNYYLMILNFYLVLI